MKRHAGILKGLWMLTGLVMLLVMAALAQKNPSVKSIELPADNPTAKLEPGPGADSAELNCLGCHSTDYIVRQPGADAEHWQAEVNKMIKLYGASVSDADAKVIVNYLAAAYGSAPPKASAAETARPGAAPTKTKSRPSRQP